jgi:hexulose-6-phosphate isomerase
MQGRLSPPVNGRIQAFPWDCWRDEFRVAGAAGFPFLEWTLDAERLESNPLMTRSGREEIRALTATTGVQVASLTGDCFMQQPFWKVEGRERSQLLDTLRAILHACTELEIPIVVVPVVDHGALESRTQRQALIDGLLEVRSECVTLGVRIALESDLPPFDLVRLLSALPADSVGINYDIGNSASLGHDPVEEISAYSERILNVHVKDRVRGGSTVPLGLGHADFPATFSALARTGYAGDFVLQTARAADDDHLGAVTRYRAMVQEWQSAHFPSRT